MKTCSVCGETYSERIDFCFNDGAVLQLMPSALDAPVPRMATAAQQEQAAAASRLRTGHTEEALVKAVETSSAVETPAPAPSTEPAEPAALPAEEEPETTEEEPAPAPPESAGDASDEEVSAGAPAALSGAQPVPDDGAAPPVFDDVAAEIGEPADDDRRVSPLLWLMGTAFLVAAVFLLAWVVKSTGAPTPDAPEVPAATAPAPEAEPPAPEPEPERAPTPEPAPADEAADSDATVEEEATEEGSEVEAAPVEAQEPAEASPEVREETPPPAKEPAAPRPAPRPEPKPKPKPESAPAPDVMPDAAPEAAPTAEAAPAAASPWDAPTQAQQATVRIVSDPIGATVRIDGILKGRTPLELPLEYGGYALSLQLEGYQPVERRIDVASPSPAFPHNLEPVVRQGNVLIIAPGWDGATLFVDGRRVGTLPAQVMLAEGAHGFEVRRAGERATDQRIVRLDERGLTRITLDPK